MTGIWKCHKCGQKNYGKYYHCMQCGEKKYICHNCGSTEYEQVDVEPLTLWERLKLLFA